MPAACNIHPYGPNEEGSIHREYRRERGMRWWMEGWHTLEGVDRFTCWSLIELGKYRGKSLINKKWSGQSMKKYEVNNNSISVVRMWDLWEGLSISIESCWASKCAYCIEAIRMQVLWKEQQIKRYLHRPLGQSQLGLSGWRICLFIPNAVRENEQWRGGFFILKAILKTCVIVPISCLDCALEHLKGFHDEVMEIDSSRILQLIFEKCTAWSRTVFEKISLEISWENSWNVVREQHENHGNSREETNSRHGLTRSFLWLKRHRVEWRVLLYPLLSSSPSFSIPSWHGLVECRLGVNCAVVHCPFLSLASALPWLQSSLSLSLSLFLYLYFPPPPPSIHVSYHGVNVWMDMSLLPSTGTVSSLLSPFPSLSLTISRRKGESLEYCIRRDTDRRGNEWIVL